MTADSGTTTAARALPVLSTPETNMPGRQWPDGLGRITRAVAARVSSASSASMYLIVACASGMPAAPGDDALSVLDEGLKRIVTDCPSLTAGRSFWLTLRFTQTELRSAIRYISVIVFTTSPSE